jgi:putative transcriptional regulator
MASAPRQRLKAAREAERYSQRLLAETVGINKSTMTNIELGRQDPTVGIALRIARVLGTTVEDLFSDDPVDNDEAA